MNGKTVYRIIAGSCLLFLIAGCVSLKEVSDYSSKSVKTLENFEELGYGFRKICNDRCDIEQLEKGNISKTSCDCNGSEEADSVSLVIYNTLKNYFKGLAKLSDNDLSSYHALPKALKEGEFGDLKINKDLVDASAKLSGILTDAYRRKKISQYIGEANGAVKTLMDELEFILVSNLAKGLDSRKQRLESYYFDLSEDSLSSGYERKKIIEEYNASLADIHLKKRQIEAMARGLKSIAAGHQMLYENRNKLNEKRIRELLTQYAGDIEDIAVEFNKLKNQI